MTWCSRRVNVKREFLSFSSPLLAVPIFIVNELLLQETFHAGDSPVQERKQTCSLLAPLALLGSDKYYSSNTHFLSVWERYFFSRGAFLISWQVFFFSVSSLTDLLQGVFNTSLLVTQKQCNLRAWWVAVLQQFPPAIAHILPTNQWRENIGSLMASPCCSGTWLLILEYRKWLQRNPSWEDWREEELPSRLLSRGMVDTLWQTWTHVTDLFWTGEPVKLQTFLQVSHSGTSTDSGIVVEENKYFLFFRAGNVSCLMRLFLVEREEEITWHLQIKCCRCYLIIQALYWLSYWIFLIR